ncbi:hypothetical protein HOF92_03640 [bacterium]|nr:hypothetical protein [bacterium]
MMTRKSYLLLSGTVFGIVSILHSVRVANSWSLTVDSWDLPIFVSWIAAGLTGLLCFWAILLASRETRD